jgi:hypothetical protein
MQRMGVLRYFGTRTIDEHTAWKQIMAPTDLLEFEITKLAQSNHEVAVLQQHVKEIIEGHAFKSSHRCGQFLKYIVDQSIAGHFELLKERIIGLELFGRPPAYDTGEDAIVRVTASEVRRRLQQHYGGTATHSEYRISLPLGSYIPSITRFPHAEVAPGEASDGSVQPHAVSEGEADAAASLGISGPSHDVMESSPEVALEANQATTMRKRRWMLFAALLLALNIGFWLVLRSSFSWGTPWPLSYLPWSTIFRSTNPIVVVTSDPNIAEIQGYTGGQLTVSDYANHNYFVGPNKLTPEEDRFCRVVLRGDKAASFDTPIAVAAGELAESVSKKIEVRGARDLQLADLKTDANFIILGSPRSNPWSGLFSDQLDFRFVINPDTRREMIVNAHPQPQEQKTYIPTAPGWATGQSYAIVAFLQNPDSNGHILLLAGANGEGTEATGKLVTELPRLSQALGQCGLDHSRAAVNFEMLLRLNTMAGSPSHVDVIACHVLRNNTP